MAMSCYEAGEGDVFVGERLGEGEGTWKRGRGSFILLNQRVLLYQHFLFQNICCFINICCCTVSKLLHLSFKLQAVPKD